MEEISNEIRLSYTDRPINDLLAGAPGGANAQDGSGAFTRHFNQQEALFLKLPEEFEVPHLPVHHDVRLPRPEPAYLDRLREVIDQLVRLAAPVFQELTHLFDPREILRPSFFKIYSVDDSSYLYLLQVDLLFRPSEHRTVAKGDNDRTPRYATRQLFLDAQLIPLERVTTEDGRIRSFTIRQLISNTWIGEVGRGYFQQGIWMDNELTRFFTRLFLPSGKRVYPFYPYLCRYKTVCQSLIRLSAEGRRQKLPYMHRAIQFLAPVMGQVEASMREGTFSENNETFQQLRRQVPAEWMDIWKGIEIEAYLNAEEMKEYRIED